MTFSYPFVETVTAADWRTWDRYGVAVTGDGRLVLETDPVPAFDSLTPLRSSGPTGTDQDADVAVRDIALDECGDLTLLSTSGEVFQYDSTAERLTRIACLPGVDETFADPRAISFAAETLYVAHGPADAPRIQAFSRHLLQQRWSLSTGLADPVALLERNGRLHVLDRGHPADTATDTDADPTPGFVATVDENARVDVVHRGLGDVVDMATDDRGWLYVLVRTDTAAETGPTYTLRVFDDTDEGVTDPWPGLTPEAFPRAGDEPLELTCLDASLDRSVYVGVAAAPDAGGGLYRLAMPARGDADEGDEVDTTEAGVSFTRLPTVTVGCAGLALDDSWHRSDDDRRIEGRLFLVRSPGESPESDRRVVSFVRTRRNLPSVGGPGRFVGRAVKRFDADTPETVWHRIQTAVDVSEPGTRVRLRYVALDTPGPTSDAEAATPADGGGPSDGHSWEVTTPAPPEGFEQIPDLSSAVARRLREANVLGVAGLAELGVDDVLTLVDPLPEPVSSTTVRRWLHAAQTLRSQWVSLAVTPPTDALLDEHPATGQSLWVELELLGDEFSSPAVDSVHAYFPRESYLQYLPAIYREDPTSAEFLLRFLSLFESTYAGLEAEFAGLSRYFDATGVPEEHLEWLAEWVGVSLDDVWSEETRRAVLARATHLSKLRGTREGLTTLLELLLEDVPEQSLSSAWETARIRERQTLDALAEAGIVDDVESALSAHAALGAQYDAFLAERVHLWEYEALACVDTAGARKTFREVLRCPQCFVVLVRAAATDEQWRAIRRTVAAETPAHAVGEVVELRSRIEVGTHTYLGVNSVVSDGQFLVDSTDLGRESTLTAREPRGQLDIGARLGSDARLS